MDSHAQQQNICSVIGKHKRLARKTGRESGRSCEIHIKPALITLCILITPGSLRNSLLRALEVWSTCLETETSGVPLCLASTPCRAPRRTHLHLSFPTFPFMQAAQEIRSQVHSVAKSSRQHSSTKSLAALFCSSCPAAEGEGSVVGSEAESPRRP